MKDTLTLRLVVILTMVVVLVGGESVSPTPSQAGNRSGDTGRTGPRAVGRRVNPRALPSIHAGPATQAYTVRQGRNTAALPQQIAPGSPQIAQITTKASNRLRVSTPAVYSGINMPAACAPGFCYKKPDGALAAGPTSVLEVVNQAFAVYDRSGNSLLGPVSLQSFFGTSTHPYDVQAIYDAGNAAGGYAGGSGRFIVTALVQGNNGPYRASELVAVSQNSSPQNGGWCTYELNGVVNFPSGASGGADYDGLGMDGRYLYITSNLLSFHSGDFLGSHVLVIPKYTAYPDASSGSCPTATSTAFDNLVNPDGTHSYSVEPANRPDAATGTSYGMYLVNALARGGAKLAVHDIVVNNGVLTLNPAHWVDVSTYSIPYSAPQPGGNNIYPGDTSLDGATWRYGQIYTSNTTRVVAGGQNVNPHASVQWYTWVPGQSTAATWAYTDPNIAYYTPQLVVGCQTNSTPCTSPYTALSFTGSSGTQPASFYSLVAGSGAPTLVQSGVPAWQYATEWGDYPGVSTDPNNHSEVWLEGEFTQSSTVWGTAISAICASSC
ncbi:MAG: hypothetical protein ACR2JC_08240 [Chloroflexota bacterium]